MFSGTGAKDHAALAPPSSNDNKSINHAYDFDDDEVENAALKLKDLEISHHGDSKKSLIEL